MAKTTSPAELAQWAVENLGMTPQAAAAIVGNAFHESGGLDVNAKGSAGEQGLFQWRGDRLTKAKASIRDWSDPRQHVAYAVVEAGPALLGQLNEAPDLNAATKVFMEKYERPGVPHLDRRQSAAAMALTQGGPVPPEALSAAGVPRIEYANQGAVRDRPLAKRLADTLKEAARRVGVAGVRIISGGQPASGSNRVGSHRHDQGNAADVQLLTEGGRVLSFADTGDRETMARFTEAATALGVTGVGAGKGYMGSQTLHVGYGTPAAWGAGGKSANAPSWLTAAFDRGRRTAGSLSGPPPVPQLRESQAPPAPSLPPRVSSSDPMLQARLDRARQSLPSAPKTIPGSAPILARGLTPSPPSPPSPPSSPMPAAPREPTGYDILSRMIPGYAGGAGTMPPVAPAVPPPQQMPVPRPRIPAVPAPQLRAAPQRQPTRARLPRMAGRVIGGLAGSALGGPVGGLLGGLLGRQIGNRAGGGRGILGNLLQTTGGAPAVAQQVLGQNYGGYTPMRSAPATSGGSPYAYTTGVGSQGQHVGSYTTDSGRTFTFYEDPDTGQTRYL